MLIDWDTVGLAPPERDLWMVVSDTGAESRRYTHATGRPVGTAALALYRVRWALYDIAAFVQQFRTRHRRTADTERMWLSLKNTLKNTLAATTGDVETRRARVSHPARARPAVYGFGEPRPAR